jgi:hypothetical protein
MTSELMPGIGESYTGRLCYVKSLREVFGSPGLKTKNRRVLLDKHAPVFISSA